MIFILVNTILLYSRLHGIVIAFTFQHLESSPDQALSVSDPFQVPVLEWLENQLKPLGDHSRHKCSTLLINSIASRTISCGISQEESPSTLVQTDFENGIKFHQLSILSSDLSLIECLCAACAVDTDLDLQLLRLQSCKRLPQIPARAVDDFIVHDGSETENINQPPTQSGASERVDLASQTRSKISMEKNRSLNLEWLGTKIFQSIVESTGKATISFDRVIQDFEDRIKAKDAVKDIVMETLCVQHVLIFHCYTCKH